MSTRALSLWRWNLLCLSVRCLSGTPPREAWRKERKESSLSCSSVSKIELSHGVASLKTFFKSLLYYVSWEDIIGLFLQDWLWTPSIPLSRKLWISAARWCIIIDTTVHNPPPFIIIIIHTLIGWWSVPGAPCGLLVAVLQCLQEGAGETWAS